MTNEEKQLLFERCAIPSIIAKHYIEKNGKCDCELCSKYVKRKKTLHSDKSGMVSVTIDEGLETILKPLITEEDDGE